jgi:hypothetical protein
MLRKNVAAGRQSFLSAALRLLCVSAIKHFFLFTAQNKSADYKKMYYPRVLSKIWKLHRCGEMKIFQNR